MPTAIPYASVEDTLCRRGYDPPIAVLYFICGNRWGSTKGVSPAFVVDRVVLPGTSSRDAEPQGHRAIHRRAPPYAANGLANQIGHTSA